VSHVRELVHGEDLAPAAKVPDFLSRRGRRRPEHHHRPVDRRDGEAVRNVVRIVDDDVHLAARDVADERADGGSHRLHPRGDGEGPAFQLAREVKCEVLRLDGAPVEERADGELRVGRIRCRAEQQRRRKGPTNQRWAFCSPRRRL
jgi:hypothetical protein